MATLRSVAVAGLLFGSMALVGCSKVARETVQSLATPASSAPVSTVVVAQPHSTDEPGWDAVGHDHAALDSRGADEGFRRDRRQDRRSPGRLCGGHDQPGAGVADRIRHRARQHAHAVVGRAEDQAVIESVQGPAPRRRRGQVGDDVHGCLKDRSYTTRRGAGSW